MSAGKWPVKPAAEIIAVGSEMLTPFRVDTDSLLITECLDGLGIRVKAKSVVGDDAGELESRIRIALERSDVVFVTGGLGPTEDDVTREAVSAALGMPLDEQPEILDRIRSRFASRGLVMPENNRKQALVPRGAVPIANPHGTAPGLWIDAGDRVLVLMPGPPREMKPMLEGPVRERLSARAGARRIYRRTLATTGLGESRVDELAKPVYERWARAVEPVECTVLAVPGSIELHLSTIDSDASRAQNRLEEATRELVAAIGTAVYSTDGRTLEEVAGELLRASGLRIAVAESCTGGLLASRITDVPGSSDYFERGVVCYSNRAKVELLGIPAEVISRHGAVSEEVAVRMSRAVRSMAACEIGVSITGIAGPGGGTAEKPVGTVFVALSDERGDEVRKLRLVGTRATIKFQSAQAALDMVRLRFQPTGSVP